MTAAATDLPHLRRLAPPPATPLFGSRPEMRSRLAQQSSALDGLTQALYAALDDAGVGPGEPFWLDDAAVVGRARHRRPHETTTTLVLLLDMCGLL